jgi:hypothetical protein
MIKDLNIRYAILKLTKENTWETLQNISTGSDFLEDSKTTGNKARIDKWNYNKLKSFCRAKEIITQ